MAEDTILVAKEGFTTEHEGCELAVRKGETFRVGHGLIEGREDLFDVFKVDNEWEEAPAPRPTVKRAAK